MKNIYRLLFLTLISFFLCNNVFAEKFKGQIKQSIIKQTKSERCAPASGSTDLNINNVRARINTGGDMWWDFTASKYEIPRGSRKTSMFASALWIGGLDIDGNLKLAAQRFRQDGQDYWTGPLTTDGTADISSEVCKEYDRHYKITKKEVQDFIADPSKITTVIEKWPAHGDVSKGQTRYLAPFRDLDGNYDYNPENGDYPYYDFTNSLCPTDPKNQNPDGTWKPLEPTMESDPASPYGVTVKGGLLVDQVLKGDMTLWWVFNDKGNDHTESKGASIGLEIRAQAFGFSTNDEINNMTFYTYEIINRSTYTLTQTYFSQWVDPDLGFYNDDFVGCDVARGLGYCYNGRATDGAGQYWAYEGNPPAIGVDFFQGPYMDPDSLDNPKLNSSGNPTVLSINGVNFGNGIVDDERFGMRRFVYYNNDINPVNGEPDKAWDYYNYLRGIWRDGRVMTYGGNGTTLGGVQCDFMFPDNTDPLFLGTGGVTVPGALWNEQTANNAPGDRRFMQSAGPFTLKPGAVNYVTVGIPWAKAPTGGPFASVKLLREVDDKCQALFDNCFKVLDGPDAPDLTVKELDRELILFISNRKGSNNEKEKYKELDVRINERSVLTTLTDTITSQSGDTTIHTTITKNDTILNDRYYKFEGYQIYQLADATVSIADLADLSKARLVKQCDLKNFDSDENSIGQLINYNKADNLNGALVPVEKVNGANLGISHTFKITEDEFASGDKRLVNHKKYYYIAIAYAYNQYKKYDPSLSDGLDGQKEPYLAGRKSASGEIRSITAIPHITSPEANGTQINATYGSTPKIKRIEGQGNGNLIIDLTQASIDALMSQTGSSYIVENPVYQNNSGPINVKVVDPLNVKPGNYTIKFSPGIQRDLSDSKWKLYNTDQNGNLVLIDESEVTINVNNEQIFVDLGLSVSIAQVSELATTSADVLDTNIKAPIENIVRDDGFLEATLTYADNTKQWLFGVPDQDASTIGFNWIRCGSVSSAVSTEYAIEDYYIKDVPSPTDPGRKQDFFLDKKEQYEKILGGTWAPYRFTSFQPNGPAYNEDPTKQMHISFAGDPSDHSNPRNLIANLSSVDVVFTADKSKWTRCPVLEMGEDNTLSIGGARKFQLRRSPSVNKEGVPDGDVNHPMGMGWFPGYAINVATGERLNIMFGEDSWLGGHNGNDMKWNPTSSYFDGSTLVFGGKHYIYIMGHNQLSTDAFDNCPAYDKGEWIYQNLKSGSTNRIRSVFYNAMWVTMPLAYPRLDDPSQIPTDAKVRLRVAKPYARYYSTPSVGASTVQNDNYPMYQFNTDDLATQKGVNAIAQSALDLIGVVPNPYYAFSNYEETQIDNRVRIINLPQKCIVTIYTLTGTLVRQFSVDKQGVTSGNGEALTSIDWDLKNFANIPISGGIYIIHVKADGIGEKTVKWFGALRPTDLNSF
ncbi:MAG: T9SS C-terminal target domain-containing protein [Bacteroidetes bacterium]|nr:T9SS C-terminal target domain-containing protein [Bacteroidota bacterium]